MNARRILLGLISIAAVLVTVLGEPDRQAAVDSAEDLVDEVLEIEALNEELSENVNQQQVVALWTIRDLAAASIATDAARLGAADQRPAWLLGLLVLAVAVLGMTSPGAPPAPSSVTAGAGRQPAPDGDAQEPTSDGDEGSSRLASGDSPPTFTSGS